MEVTLRTLLIFLLALVLAILLVVLLRPPMWQPPPSPRIQFVQPPVIQSQGPTTERLEQLSRLVATRVYVADVLIGEGNGCRGVWLVHGDALIAVDLSKAAIVTKDDATKKATIRLPQPEILQARVDHERTRTWEVKSTTWIPWTSDSDSLRDEVMKHAQRLVARAAASGENLSQAKRSAESVIRGFYSEVGWTVAVTWASPSEAPKDAPATK
jgi:hypothetical protein